MKSQSAIEFLTIVSLGLVLIAIASFFGMDYITSHSSDMNVINARQTVESVVSSTNLVYAQGIDAQSRVFVTMPNNLLRENTFISGNVVNLRFVNGGARDLYRTTKIPVFGTLPLNPGRVQLITRMESFGAVVGVSGHELAYMYVLTFSDSAMENYETEFGLGEPVYYSIYVEDENLMPKEVSINIQVFNPTKMISETDTEFMDSLWGIGHPYYWQADNYEWTNSLPGTGMPYMDVDKTIPSAMYIEYYEPTANYGYKGAESRFKLSGDFEIEFDMEALVWDESFSDSYDIVSNIEDDEGYAYNYIYQWYDGNGKWGVQPVTGNIYNINIYNLSSRNRWRLTREIWNEPLLGDTANMTWWIFNETSSAWEIILNTENAGEYYLRDMNLWFTVYSDPSHSESNKMAVHDFKINHVDELIVTGGELGKQTAYNGTLTGVFYPDEPGAWLLSAMHPDSRFVSGAIVKVFD